LHSDNNPGLFSILAIIKFPLSFAISHGNFPQLSLTSLSAPFINRFLITLIFSPLTAKCRGVYPSLSFLSNFEPMEINIEVDVSHPKKAAQCSGVSPL